MAHTVIELRTGAPGTGKTWGCVRQLVEEFLPEESGPYWSNLPLRRQAIADFMAERTGRPPVEFFDRLCVIPREELERWREAGMAAKSKGLRGDAEKDWRDGLPGPWSFFADRDLSGARIVIDEAHHYAGEGYQDDFLRRWREWLGEIRHRGATVSFVTQHPMKLDKEVKRDVSVQVELVAGETERDKWFRISFADWYQLRAKWFGVYVPAVLEIHRRQETGKWKEHHRRWFWRRTAYFGLYDSHAAPVAGGAAGESSKQPWERHGWPGLLWWFVCRHPVALFARVAVVAGILAFPHVLPWLTRRFMSSMRRAAPAAEARAEPQTGDVAAALSAARGQAMPVAASKLDDVAGDTGSARREATTARAEADAQRVRAGELMVSLEAVQTASAELRADLESITAERDALRGAKDAALAEAARWRAELERLSAVVMIAVDGTALLGSGDRVRVGETVEFGVYAGSVVSEVDAARRIVRLTDGRVLRMGRALAPAGAAVPDGVQLFRPGGH